MNYNSITLIKNIVKNVGKNMIFWLMTQHLDASIADLTD